MTDEELERVIDGELPPGLEAEYRADTKKRELEWRNSGFIHKAGAYVGLLAYVLVRPYARRRDAWDWVFAIPGAVAVRVFQFLAKRRS